MSIAWWYCWTCQQWVLPHEVRATPQHVIIKPNLEAE